MNWNALKEEPLPLPNYQKCPIILKVFLNIELLFVCFTGEMSHHDVLDAIHSNVSVILCNHSNSERGYLKEFKDTLTKLLNESSIEILLSESDADPLVTH